MNSAPVIKRIIPILLALSISPSLHAQAYNNYQQYPPTYYYNQNRTAYPYGYSYPSAYNYNYGYQGHQRYPQQQYAPAPQAPAPQQPAPAQTRSQGSRSTAESTDISNWMTDWNDAWKKAQRLGRPLVVLVVHHGCPECDRMDATLSQPEALHTLDSAVKVRLEFSNNAEFLHKYQIKYTPTFLVFSPAHEGEVYREVGALSLDRLKLIQPSIEALVTEPRTTSKKQTSSSDKATSRSVAAL